VKLVLSDRVAIVTGGSRGIGRAVAAELAAAGARVAVAARGDHAEAAAAEIAGAGGVAMACAAEMGDADSVRAMVERVLDTWGQVDVFVHSAGIARDQLLARMKAEDWDDVLAVNLRGAFVGAQAVLRPMMKRRWGRIILIGSVVGQTGNPGQTNYAASKAGLAGFAKSLAREVASRGITVNVVAPGFIDTEMTRSLSDAVREQLASSIPLGRLGTPADVAAAVGFLASDGASYITGHVLSVNGGMHT